MGSEYTPEIIDTLKQKVFISSRDGMAISIFAMLWNVERDIVRDVLNHYTAEDGQKTTPLVISARNGEEKVVAVLISNFSETVDIEQTGTVKFDGFVIEGATSLWCAAGAGHFGVVSLFIRHGADVNHPTVTNSTPLRAACFDGRIDIVKFLVENKADIKIANKYDNTCLMISSYKGHTEIVEYLLDKGADPDCTAHCGATALHFAAECGHLEIVKVLVSHKASWLKNDHGMTALMVAAESAKSKVVEFMISLPQCTKQEKVDALELLGSSFANDKENYDISMAFSYLREAMHVRFSDTNNILYKPESKQIEAYENKVESKNIEELNTICKEINQIHMEALVIRERILGSDNPELPHPIIFRGAVFADCSRFDRCISLWIHAMKLRQKNQRSIAKDLLRFAQVFSQMVVLKVNLQFKIVEQVFNHSIMELQWDKERLEPEDDDHPGLAEVYQSNIHTCLYLLIIAISVLDLEKSDKAMFAKKEACLYVMIYRFLKLQPVLKNNYTPLHMSVDAATIVDDFHVHDVVQFPSAALTKHLVKCGADINALDLLRNTPLHIIAKYENDSDIVCEILNNLIDNGAHLDICNIEGFIPLQLCKTASGENLLRSNMHLSLKCISAKAIQKHKIMYQNIVPQILEEFISIH